MVSNFARHLTPETHQIFPNSPRDDDLVVKAVYLHVLQPPPLDEALSDEPLQPLWQTGRSKESDIGAIRELSLEASQERGTRLRRWSLAVIVIRPFSGRTQRIDKNRRSERWIPLERFSDASDLHTFVFIAASADDEKEGMKKGKATDQLDLGFANVEARHKNLLLCAPDACEECSVELGWLIEQFDSRRGNREAG